MKLSRKLTKKINCFSETYDGLKKAASAVSEDIAEMKELTEDGAEAKISNFSKKASVVARKFFSAVEGLKDQVEDTVVAADEVAEVATAETPADADVEAKAFARKARILKKEFAEIAQKFDEVAETVATVLDAKDQQATTVKESVVPPAKELVEDADPEGTTAKVSGNPPAKEIDPSADPKKTDVKESVVPANFSKVEYYKFSLGSALKAFGEFLEGLDGAGDVAAEVIYPIAEPASQKVEEAAPAPVTAACPVCGNDPCTCVSEAPKTEEVVATETVAELPAEAPKVEEAALTAGAAPATSEVNDELAKVDAEVDAEKNALVDAGLAAIKANDVAASDEVAKKAEELEARIPGAGEEVITKIENFSAKKEFEACPECGKEPCECPTDYTKDQEILVEQGIKAFATNDDDKLAKVANFCQELENMEAGKGQEVISVLENFASLYKLGFNTKKNFESEKDFGVIGAVKELICFAADKMMSGEKWDKDEIAAKCEDLEQQAPGAGDIVVSTLENFEAIKKFCETSGKPETAEKIVADFSTELEKFVEEIPTADRTFAHKMKKACFEALEFCDAGDSAKVAQFCREASAGFGPEVQDEKLAKFCGTLKDFCGRFDALESATAGAIPEDVAQKDVELNEVIDKMGEKGALLPANIASFAKKLCDSYKSMKCFNEEQLEKKLALVEGLKGDFCTAGVNFDEEGDSSKKEEESVEKTEEAPKAEETSETTTEETTSEESTEETKTEEAPAETSTEETPATESTETTEEVKTEETSASTEEAPAETTEGSGEEDASAKAVAETEGDADYDPSKLGDLASLKDAIKEEIKQELIEEEVIDDSDKPSDPSVVVPMNFSEKSDEYGKVFNSIWDSEC